jgi:hypothetical protein
VNGQHIWRPLGGAAGVLRAAIISAPSRDLAVSFACPRSRADPRSLRLLLLSCRVVWLPGHFSQPGPTCPVGGLSRGGPDLAGPVLHCRRAGSSQVTCGPGARATDGDRPRRRPPRAAMPCGGPSARPPTCCGGIRAVAIQMPGKGPAEPGRSGRPDLQRWAYRPPRPVRARPTPSAVPAEGGWCGLAAVMGHRGRRARHHRRRPRRTRHRTTCPAGRAGSGPTRERPGKEES